MPQDISIVDLPIDNTDDEIQRARKYTASCALDVEDATLLMDMLGLIPPQTPIMSRLEGKKIEERERNARRRQK